MAVDTNFERLEQEVTRLVDLLARMRQDNADQKQQLEQLTADNTQLQSRLAQAESDLDDMGRNRDMVRGRIEDLLTRLESVES